MREARPHDGINVFFELLAARPHRRLRTHRLAVPCSRSSGDEAPSPQFLMNRRSAVDELTPQQLLTDALLLDAAEGIDSIADRLVELYDRWAASPGYTDDAALLASVLTDLGWWRGRFQGAISTETADALDRVVSGGS
jgi:hypothetical protein